MKQYCRYCCYLCVGNGNYCEKRNIEMSEATAKSINRCHDFAYNHLDAYNTDKEYEPRQPRKKQCEGQISLFG